jgi:hypothetical protein
MGRDGAKHKLLSSSGNDYSDDDLESYDVDEKKFTTEGFGRNINPYLLATLSLSFILNIVLFIAYYYARSQMHLCPSEYSKYSLPTSRMSQGS